MKRYTLNIGLNIGERADALSLSRVTLAVERAIEPHGRILSLNVHRSATESTAVVVVESVDLAGGRWWHLASELEQEAVSVWDEDRATGYLYGPEAVRWGLFNPEYFLLPDGLSMNAERPNVAELADGLGATLAALDGFEPVDVVNFAAWMERYQLAMNSARAILAKLGK